MNPGPRGGLESNDFVAVFNQIVKRFLGSPFVTAFLHGVKEGCHERGTQKTLYDLLKDSDKIIIF